MKDKLKKWMKTYPIIWVSYWRVKQELKRLFLMRYFLYDANLAYQFMFWGSRDRNRRRLSAELLFQYHKIEKGLVMPEPKRLFGIDPVLAVMDLLKQWRENNFEIDDPIYLGAVESLISYHDFLSTTGLDKDKIILPDVIEFLDGISVRDIDLKTPYELPQLDVTGKNPIESFENLMHARRSVRDFKTQPIDLTLIKKAVELAQLSPSACNRQPWKVYLVSDPDDMKTLLSHQNGNRGFGHLAPHVAIITADSQCFFDSSERNEPFVDGGMFAMSLILSLRAQEIATCCLNWCVSPSTDKTVHQIFGIPKSEKIIMLLAIGYPSDGVSVPRSVRFPAIQVLDKIASTYSSPNRRT